MSALYGANPEAEAIRTVAANRPEWVNRIALRVGHFVAKLIQGKGIDIPFRNRQYR